MSDISDLAFFKLVATQGSLAGAAQELGLTPSAVSKRLSALEARLGVRLLHRTTRRIAATPEGETYLVEGSRILADVDTLERQVSGSRAIPKGLLRIGGTLGFGRRHVAPALSAFGRRYPDVEVQLHLTDRPGNFVDQGFDVQIRIGELPDARLTARRLALNRRVLVASPRYLARAPEPMTPRELAQHECIFIREGDEAFGTWHLSQGARQETVKVRGHYSTNDGETATNWALDGHGILLRSQWEVAAFVREGRLQVVLEAWRSPPADIYAVFPTRSHLSAKTRAVVDFLAEWFRDRNEVGSDMSGLW